MLVIANVNSASSNMAAVLNTQANTFLCFDYGTKKIGVATGQSITGTASGIAVLGVKENTPDWTALEKLVAQWNPQAFVVGMPFNMDGTENEMTKRVKKFSARLTQRFQKPVHEVDERLSTREAREISRSNAEQNGKRYDNRNVVDSLAAQLILESFLRDGSS